MVPLFSCVGSDTPTDTSPSLTCMVTEAALGEVIPSIVFPWLFQKFTAVNPSEFSLTA